MAIGIAGSASVEQSEIEPWFCLRDGTPIERPNRRSPGPANIGDLKQDLRYTNADGTWSAAMANESDHTGVIEEIEIHESAAIIVEQIDDEITVAVASIVSINFQVTADQALKLSRALAVAAENASKFGPA
ncbi:hypothetical protein ACIPUD_10565 [Bradyrhizobium sp. CAR08]